MKFCFPLFRVIGFVVVAAAPVFGQTDAARTERVLAAVAAFEATFEATSDLAETAPAAADLITLLDRELPAGQSDLLCNGVANYYYQHGGVWGFQKLVARTMPPRAALLRQLVPEKWRAELRTAEALAPTGQRTKPGWSDESAGWPTAVRGKRGPPLARDKIDLPRTRARAVIGGDFGALLDLGYAKRSGLDTTQDHDLALFWGKLARAANPTLHEKIFATPAGGIENLRVQAEAGCAWAMVNLSVKLLPDDQSPIPPGEARSWLEKAAALGFTASASYLTWRGVAGTPSAATPEQAAALAALVTLDQALLTSPNYDTVGKCAAELVNALDRLSDQRAADAVAMAAPEFLLLHGGAREFFAFQMTVSDGRLSRALKFAATKLSPGQKATLQELADQTVSKAVGGTGKAVNTSLWRASRNPLPDLKTDDLLDLAKVRLAFVKGATGAAMDFEVAYEFGSGATRHAGAAAFWHAVVAQLPPGLNGAGTTLAKALREAAGLGSVFALSDLADELQRQNGGKLNDEVVALRRRAEAGGLRPAGGTGAPVSSPVAVATQPVAAPHLPPALVTGSPAARAILDRPEYRLPLANLDQERQAHAAAIAGVTAAISQGEPAALVAHLAGWMRVRRAAEDLARRDAALKLPARDLQAHLLSLVEPARKAGHFGTVFLLRLAMDREQWWRGKAIDERETVQTDQLGWLNWRQGALISLPWLMLVASDGDLAASGPAIPPWASVLRHPAELLDGRFVPLLNVPPERLASSDLKSLNASYRRDPTAVLLTIHPPAAWRAPEIIAGRTRTVTQRVPAVNRNYEREVAERNAALAATFAALDAKIAELDKKIAVINPVVESRTKKRVLVTTERKATYRTRSINENGPGTRQGDQVSTGWVDVPVYREVEEVQKSPDWNHPLYREKRTLEAERKNPPQKPEPSQLLATGTDAVTTHYDRWTATPTVAVTLKENGVERTLRLEVPMTFELARPSGQAAPGVALGSAGLRRMLNHPATYGAAAVHRAVAAFLLRERLKPMSGQARADTEAALVAELLFGLEPDDGPVLTALREIGQPGAAK